MNAEKMSERPYFQSIGMIALLVVFLSQLPDTHAADLSSIPQNLATPLTGPVSNSNSDEVGSVGELGSDLTKGDISKVPALAKKAYTVIIDLGDNYQVNLVNFRSFTAEGTVTASVSPIKLGEESDAWKGLTRSNPFKGGRNVSLPLTGVDTRYVRLQFAIATAGKIGDFGVFSTDSVKDYEFAPEPEPANMLHSPINNDNKAPLRPIRINVASLAARAKVVAVSSQGDQPVETLLDENVDRWYNFAPDDANPFVVLKLLTPQKIVQVSSVVNDPSKEVRVFFLKNVPDKDDIKDYIKNHTPDVTMKLTEGNGVQTMVVNPVNVQYILYSWSGNPGSVYDVSLMALTKQPYRSLPGQASTSVPTPARTPPAYGNPPKIPVVSK